MANAQSLRRIGYGLGAVTVLVSLVAAALVVDATRTTAQPPTVQVALQ